MWGIKLITGVLNAGKKIVGSNTTKIDPVVTRRILNNGNGKMRCVVKGFGEGNYKPSDIVSKSLINNSRNLRFRKVIAGFTGEKGQVKLTSPQFASFVKFMPIFRIPKLIRHYVANASTTRNVIRGFNSKTQESLKTTKAIVQTTNENLNSERVVVQGFGGNASKPVFKTVTWQNSTPRTVVKGFNG